MKRDRKWHESGCSLAVGLALSIPATAACSGSEAAGAEWEPGAPRSAQAAVAVAEGVTRAASALPFARGGERLAAMHHLANGAEQFQGFKDRELDVDCKWVHAPDRASFRCVPAHETNVVYLDAACTQPAMPVWAHSTHPKLVSDQGAPTSLEKSCGTTFPLPRQSYRVREQVREGGLQDRSVLYAKTEDGCRPAALGGLLRPAALRLEPISESAFVSGRIRDVDVGGGLFAQRLEADDGTQTTLGVTGPHRKPCELLPSGVCVPGRIARHRERWAAWFTQEAGLLWADVYQDARCEVTAFAHGSDPRCGNPEYGLALHDGHARIHSLTLATEVFLKTLPTGGSEQPGCASWSVSADQQPVFVAGPDVTASLPAAQRVRTGSGPLFREQLAGASESVVPLEQGGPFIDAAGRSCSVMPAEDGSLRCFPDRYRIDLAGYWRDPSCTEQLFVSEVQDLSDLVVMADQSMYRPSTIRALSTTKVYDGPTYGRGADWACEAMPGPTGLRLLTRDQALPITVLPKVELVAL